jgi:hypothetical protein
LFTALGESIAKQKSSTAVHVTMIVKRNKLVHLTAPLPLFTFFFFASPIAPSNPHQAMFIPYNKSTQSILFSL